MLLRIRCPGIHFPVSESTISLGEVFAPKIVVRGTVPFSCVAKTQGGREIGDEDGPDKIESNVLARDAVTCERSTGFDAVKPFECACCRKIGEGDLYESSPR